ncbi:ComEA family DNA-binding protein [Hydrogenimonas sp.]
MKFLVTLALFAAALFAAVDLNHATVKELQSVKGIGPKKAKQIVEYRTQHCFESVDDLVKIKGIGKKTLKKLKPQLTVTPCQ